MTVVRDLPIVTSFSSPAVGEPADDESDFELTLADIVKIVRDRWITIFGGALTIGAVAYGATYLVEPTYISRTIFLVPQQAQSAATSALASLNALSGIGGLGGIKTTGDQYVSLMKTDNAQDHIIDKFKLMDLYDAKFRFEARKELAKRVRITLGKKDGLITVEAEANSPDLAASLANQHVDELRRLSSELALTEAQQRRKFFEAELKRTRSNLAAAQEALQQGGFNPGALKAEPKAAAEGYGRIKAEVTAAEVRLQTLRRALADSAPEVQTQLAMLSALRGQLAKLENLDNGSNEAGYISRYRDYKYQETLFEMFSRQYESARLDESREGALIQVVDVATPPERPARPRRGTTAALAMLGGLLLLSLLFVVRRLRANAPA
jgi:uncharacterized protein involved in exopolysaccharide biosynthesis